MKEGLAKGVEGGNATVLFALAVGVKRQLGVQGFGQFQGHSRLVGEIQDCQHRRVDWLPINTKDWLCYALPGGYLSFDQTLTPPLIKPVLKFTRQDLSDHRTPFFHFSGARPANVVPTCISRMSFPRISQLNMPSSFCNLSDKSFTYSKLYYHNSLSM